MCKYMQCKASPDCETHTHARTHARAHARAHARTHACTHAHTHTHSRSINHLRTLIATDVILFLCAIVIALSRASCVVLRVGGHTHTLY